MFNRYVVLFGVLGLLLAGYAVWWHREAARLEAAVPGYMARALPEGARLSQTVAGVDGFPFRLNVQLTDVTLAWGDGDTISTPSLTVMFQPLNNDHLIFHLDAPVAFAIDGASGSFTAERGLASMVGYETGRLRLDADSVNVALAVDGGAPVMVERVQGHMLLADGQRALSVAVKDAAPGAASGRLASLFERYGEPGQNGNLTLVIDEKDGVYHARGKALDAADGEALRRLVRGD
ncbi:DUF2125 domain-containing protein [Iodidimonas sp. SYSU 1G8]|uniref:DUF2125 domain-containing protein n=1 Tax=Iodidimonas sp. SYSU 1G8 TaxID=3133967 RepID=UPI0031FED322